MPRGDKPTTTALAIKDGWVYEDTLPKNISRPLYDWWFKESLVLDGVRMGPPLFVEYISTEPVNPVPATPADGLTECEIDELRELLENANPIFRQRVMAAISTASPEPVPQLAKCVKCGHGNGVYPDGSCRFSKMISRHAGHRCICKCEFASLPVSGEAEEHPLAIFDAGFGKDDQDQK